MSTISSIVRPMLNNQQDPTNFPLSLNSFPTFQDRGIRGVFWADPCFSSRYVVCSYGRAFQTLERSTTMLNSAFEDKSMDLFGLLGVPRLKQWGVSPKAVFDVGNMRIFPLVLGHYGYSSLKPKKYWYLWMEQGAVHVAVSLSKDNLYDQGGDLTRDFFSRVSLNVKRRFWLMVNGNHDNWVCGFPMCGSPADDFGIGQMQYYPMDSIASQDNQVFSFDIDPDQHRGWNRFLNNASNFLFYHKLGNVPCMQLCHVPT